MKRSQRFVVWASAPKAFGCVRAFLFTALLALRPETAHACAACFGKSDSAMAKGMNMGIFTLLFFIVGVLGALSCFFVFLAVRSSKLTPRDPAGDSQNSPDNPAHS
jgi:hypothetical protein